MAVLVDVLTDNRNRTGAEVRNVFAKMGGSIAEPGSVSWQFERKGRRARARATVDEDDVMMAALDAGADDIADDGDTWQHHVRAGRRSTQVREAPRGRRARRRVGRVARWSPPRRCRSRPRSDAKKVLRVIDALEDNDDVQDVYANFDIPDEHPRSRWTPDVAVGVGDPAPDFTLPGTGGRSYTPVRLPGPAGRARLLPGRRHARLHQAAQRATPTTSASSRRSTPRCSASARSRSRATSASPSKDGFAFPLLADVDKKVGAALRHARAARLPAPLGVRDRRRRHHPLRAPLGGRAHVPADGRAGRGGPQGVLRVLTLAGRMVRLEPLGPDHADALAAAATEDRSSYGFTWVPGTRDEAVAYIETAAAERAAGTSIPFATVRLADDRVVGSTRFLNLRAWGRPGSNGDPDVAEIGATWLAGSAQRSPVNTEAKLLQLTHAFDVWGVERLELKTDARNDRSRAAIERLGARFEGVLRAYQPAADHPGARDTAMYSILAAEWPDVRTNLLARLAT